MLYIRVCPGLSFATKRIGQPCCTLVTLFTCYPLRFILSQNYLLPTISVLAENTLLKTACHFLLLLVGFDTLTYRMDYDRSPLLMGHHQPGRMCNAISIIRCHLDLLSCLILSCNPRYLQGNAPIFQGKALLTSSSSSSSERIMMAEDLA